MLKSIIATVVITGSVVAFANQREEMDAQVKQACAAEITTTGCGEKSIGRGLMRCMHEYKRAHKDFKISDGCREVKHQLKAEHKERKEAKAAKEAAPTK